MAKRRVRPKKVQPKRGQGGNGSGDDSGRHDLNLDKLVLYYMASGMEESEAKQRAKLEMEWWDAVWDRCKGRCACGETKKLRAHLIHPPYLGGRMVPENGYLLCNRCLRAREKGVSEYIQERWGPMSTKVNFNCPRELYQRVQDLAGERGMSVATVLRELLVGWVGAHDSRLGVQTSIEGKPVGLVRSKEMSNG